MKRRTNDRKLQHIKIIRADGGTDRHKGYFDEIRLAHRALPELNLSNINPATRFLGKSLSFPLLISCMTGGDHAVLRRINRNLALAAEAENVAFGVGSQRVMFSSPKARASFAVREWAPTALVFANLGAVQLNRGFGLKECRAAVEVAGADALCLHLNPLQEAVQPEGDTDFAGLTAKIGAVARGLKRPVILKEVGAGLSLADVQLARRHGLRYFDVAGAGGLSWSRVEHHRQDIHDLGLTFQDWGIPTPAALRALKPIGTKIELIASGGVRSGVDMVKAVILGARLCGIASPFLRPAMESPGAVRAVIQRLRREFCTAMFLLSAKTVDALRGNEALLLK